MNRIDIASKLKTLIVEQLGVDDEEVTEEASFQDNLGADSLDTIELVMAAEEDFGIELPDDEFVEVRTVKDAIDLLERKLS